MPLSTLICQYNINLPFCQLSPPLGSYIIVYQNVAKKNEKGVHKLSKWPRYFFCVCVCKTPILDTLTQNSYQFKFWKLLLLTYGYSTHTRLYRYVVLGVFHYFLHGFRKFCDGHMLPTYTRARTYTHTQFNPPT